MCGVTLSELEVNIQGPLTQGASFPPLHHRGLLKSSLPVASHWGALLGYFPSAHPILRPSHSACLRFLHECAARTKSGVWPGSTLLTTVAHFPNALGLRSTKPPQETYFLPSHRFTKRMTMFVSHVCQECWSCTDTQEQKRRTQNERTRT